MNYRKLGQTGLVVSEVGFGAWGIGGTSGGSVAYGATDDTESLAALKRALDAGITFYDTSDLYGFGHSEEILGLAFKDVRDRIVIASKVGFVTATTKDFSPGRIRAAAEASLRRLKTDYIDLYQLHDISINELKADPNILGVLEALKREGKIRAIGISVKSPAEGLPAVKEFGFKSVQANFNMIDQRGIETGLFEACLAEGASVIARTPLCFGFLTGMYSEQTVFPAGDHRANWPRGQIALWAGAHKLFMPAIQDRGTQTNGQMAIRYCLSYPAVASVIPGMLTVPEVDENSVAGDFGPLRVEDRTEVERIYRNNTFFLPRK